MSALQLCKLFCVSRNTETTVVTSVAPPSIFLESLWLCAQKSIQHVTPENGRLSLFPMRHSRPSFSCLTWNKNDLRISPELATLPKYF